MRPVSGNQHPDLNISDEHVSCTARARQNASLQILFKCPTSPIVFGNATKPSRFAWCAVPRLPRKTTPERPEMLRTCTCQFFTLLAWECASRHNGVHFFDTPTSKSCPRPSVFNTFDFEMCFAPQRLAFFRHFNFQSGPGMVCFVHFDFKMCFAPQRAIFHLSSGQMAPHPPL